MTKKIKHILSFKLSNTVISPVIVDNGEKLFMIHEKASILYNDGSTQDLEMPINGGLYKLIDEDEFKSAQECFVATVDDKQLYFKPVTMEGAA